MSEHTGPRPFNLGDLMIFVAVIALDLATAVEVQRRLPAGWSSFLQGLGPHLARPVSWMLVSYVAASLTPALLAARLRRPRPGFREIARQPGTAACLSALLVMVVQFSHVLWEFLPPWANTTQQAYTSIRTSPTSSFEVLMVTRSNGAVAYGPFQFAGALIQPVGFAVAAGWLVLATTEVWRAEPGWIDRIGRALGVTWILLTLTAIITV